MTGLVLDPTVVAAFQAHALAEHPREACGVVTEKDGVQAFVPLENAAQDPVRDFRIPARVYARHAQSTVAILHSHTNGIDCPSEADMRGQLTTAKPWGLMMTNGEACGPLRLWGDGVPILPLIGRPFVHGIADCYSLVRDYYRQERGIHLPEVPRDDAWWSSGQNLYLDHLEPAGFRRIAEHEARPGDGFLMGIASGRHNPGGVINHAGVLVTTDLILHHLPNRLSRREPAGPWVRHVALWVRHDG